MMAEAEVFPDDPANVTEETSADCLTPLTGRVSSSVANDQLKHCYRDKKRGHLFVNSTQQTQHRKKNNHDLVQCFTRETQLCETRNQCWNTTRETWTQMDRPGLILDATRDCALDIRPYKDSKAYEENRNKAAIIIQGYARRKVARCKARRLQKYAKERIEEVKFFQAIEKMKMAAGREKKEQKIQTMMSKMSAPKKWELSDGRVVHVQTLDTQRALDLMKLYTALSKCSRTVDERMCVLGYIKWTVQEFDCQLTKELIQLIERAADLMYRNRPTASLQGLRQRILDLFLKFTQVPKFNPEAAAYQCIPNDFDHPSCQTLRQQSIPVCLRS